MMSTSARGFAALALIFAFVSGCSSNPVTLTPQPAAPTNPGATPTATAQPTATPAKTASPGPTPTATAGSAAAKIVAALTDAQSYYANLPTTTPLSELQATAKHMVSSGNFTAAVVGPGGITGTFPGGQQAALFADRREELDPSASATASARRPAVIRMQSPGGISGASTSHEIAYFINTTDYSGAFTPSRQVDLAGAWPMGYGSALSSTYEADAIPVTLENIIALGTNHPVDYLSLGTHGMVALVGAQQTPTYINQSDTKINATTIATYLPDIMAHNIFHSVMLIRPNGQHTVQFTLPELAFTPAWVTAHVHFNPGAYFDNESCYGQNPMISSAVTAVYAAAGVAQYSGWTYPVDGNDADESDSFLADRLLGEPSSALAAYVSQRSPLQRPFDLPDILSAMASETRNGGVGNAGNPYTYSPPTVYSPTSAWPASILVTTGSGTITDDIIFPSIATLTVSEGTPTSTLRIDGEFPVATGKVMFTPPGGSAIALTIDSWSATDLIVDLPDASSGGVAGNVTVVGPTGLVSPVVPLTSWSGTFIYKENTTISDFGSDSGTGTGSLGIALNLGIRADVAPVVPTIDVSPVPQNLYISNVTPNSTGTLKNYKGSFTSSDPADQTATITGSGSVSLAPYGTANFIQVSSSLNPVGGAAACNNAMPGPQDDGQGNIGCPGFAYAATGAGTCSDNQDGALCGQATEYGAQIGMPSSQYGDDEDYDNTPSTLTFTMDPTNYTIAVTSTTGTTYTENYSDFSPTKENLSGTFSAPLQPPLTSVTADGRRRSASRNRLR
jgi:hypothetical protein